MAMIQDRTLVVCNTNCEPHTSTQHEHMCVCFYVYNTNSVAPPQQYSAPECFVMLKLLSGQESVFRPCLACCTAVRWTTAMPDSECYDPKWNERARPFATRLVSEHFLFVGANRKICTGISVAHRITFPLLMACTIYMCLWSSAAFPINFNKRSGGPRTQMWHFI